MKILLHTCCAPCLIYPLEKLRGEGMEVEGLFYNPNVHPFAEYSNRKQAVEDFAAAAKLKLHLPAYMPQEFFRTVNFNEENPPRCSMCWRLRLKKTATLAKQGSFGAFSTTLLVSPYQNQELIQSIGNEISNEVAIPFHYEDFRPGFYQAHQEAKAKGIYCQRYCGCIYSEIERCKKP